MKKKKRKKLIAIKGTKTQKICLFLQILLLITMIASSVYCNVNNIETGFITQISDYCFYAIIILLLITIIFNKDDN